MLSPPFVPLEPGAVDADRWSSECYWARALFLVAMCYLSLGCVSGLQVRNAKVLGVEKDEATQASRVSVTFEVWDGDVQLTNLSRESFQLYEDGVRATSESLAQADVSEKRVPLVLVLDTSLSMYQANAVRELKAAATSFRDSVAEEGFDVVVYRFANTVSVVENIEAIPDEFDDEGGERFTSLYAAAAKAMAEHPDGIVVVFSDGADTYSQNHGVKGLAAVERSVLPTAKGGGRVVHAIAFGNVKTEQDKQGIPAMTALERLSRNGSLKFAADKSALATVFADLAKRISNFYVYDFYSPNLSGTHKLVIEVTANGKIGKSKPVTYTSTGGMAASGSNAAIPDYMRKRLEKDLATCETTPEFKACDLASISVFLNLRNKKTKDVDPELVRRALSAQHRACQLSPTGVQCSLSIEHALRFGLLDAELAFGNELCASEGNPQKCSWWLTKAGSHTELADVFEGHLKALCAAGKNPNCDGAVQGLDKHARRDEIMLDLCKQHSGMCGGLASMLKSVFKGDRAVVRELASRGCKSGDAVACVHVEALDAGR